MRREPGPEASLGPLPASCPSPCNQTALPSCPGWAVAAPTPGKVTADFGGGLLSAWAKTSSHAALFVSPLRCPLPPADVALSAGLVSARAQRLTVVVASGALAVSTSIVAAPCAPSFFMGSWCRKMVQCVRACRSERKERQVMERWWRKNAMWRGNCLKLSAPAELLSSAIIHEPCNRFSIPLQHQVTWSGQDARHTCPCAASVGNSRCC